ncbi:AlpA family transcriptional regulator [Desulfopila sp. IMCC35008]|uniref:helix-turn-helix transcriptional regulator n=1 Tax=Desulfopila sp. IMCC35008 TaxID=2653858 RepID=UPI0013D7B3E4|nr:AlpA family phage regulatory protein [Desulfopila sp. IMCC35008]
MRRIIRLGRVTEITGLSKSTIRRMELEGRFPRRVRLSRRTSGFFEDEVESHLENLQRVDLVGKEEVAA